MNVGFTGTRQGMTDEQDSALAQIIHDLKPEWLHHGDCVGADEEAHAMAIAWSVQVQVHPPVNSEHRAWCAGDVELLPLTHFARNRAIVDATDMLVAASLTPHRTDRGGTWYTVDYAVKRGKPVKVIWPDGRVEDWTGK